MPDVTLPPRDASPLPIDLVLEPLAEALQTGTRAVLVAAPGAGKTTRVPVHLLDAQWRGDGRIIVLEPRRIAARAAAARVAQMLGEKVGETVGYRVRMENRTGPKTRIEFVTEGIFTRQILADPELSGVAAVVFDEFHERSLDADLGLALALDAAELRDDLRILIMSATLDSARLARLLGDCPVIESQGRAFPIETRHLPRDPDDRIESFTARAILGALDQEHGSILVFLPGQAEISRVAERLAGSVPSDVDVVQLHGRLTASDQDAAIRPAVAGRRKVVLSTNVAQTSLTIEGIRVVIDTGLARVPIFEPGMGLTRLETRRISQAAAEQRRGRAGRVEPGVCYRLWHEGQTGSLQLQDIPEILGADLTGLVLDLANWGVADPADMMFPDQPPGPAWSEARALLGRLGALDAEGRITAHGRALATLPVHPRLGHMIMGSVADGHQVQAARLAVLLSEPGLGGTSPDLAERMANFERDSSARARGARALAARWARTAGGRRAEGPGPDFDPGRALALAFPDRVAQSLETGTFRLANGRQGRIEQGDPLARHRFIVAVELSGQAAKGIIRMGAALDGTDLETLFSNIITDTVETAFQPDASAVRARQVRRFDALVLREGPVAIGTDQHDAAARCLAKAIAAMGVGRLRWSRDQLSLRARASYLHGLIGNGWPDLSDAALAEGDATWLVPHIMGLSKLSAITAEHLSSALHEMLPWGRRQEMDRLLPSHFTVPTGSRIAIDYDSDNGPVLAVRVQELFGLDRHPSIADGRIQLLVTLLSPARRPIQATRDLPGFWRGSWRDVARDLKGRYPKHPWPEDPLAALPTMRTKNADRKRGG